MIDALLPIVLVISATILVVTVRTLGSSRRAEDLGEDRYEFLRDQRERLDMLREEHRMLTEELERESQERRRLMEYLEETDPRLKTSSEGNKHE
jgi:hypothetical protein